MKQRLRDLEARDNWIAARVDELMDDEEWKIETAGEWNYEPTDEGFYLFSKNKATEQAIREHAAIIADLEEAIIDSMELK